MSSPSSVQPCPEPSAYSNDSYSAAEVEATAPSASLETAVMDNKGVSSRFAEIDSILSNQLGPVTVPTLTAPSSSTYNGFPVLPSVNESSATPVLSSNMGADINNSFTLLQNPGTLPTNQLGSDIAPTVSIPVTASTALPNLVSFTPTSTITGPTTVAPSGPVAPIQSNIVTSLSPSESFDNVNQNKLKPSNIAKFIQKNEHGKKEHFNGSSKGKKEHFGLTTGSSMTDTLILCAVVGVAIYYIISPADGAGLTNSVESTVSKLPVLSQLVDPNVSDTNKLLIVAAVVLAFIFISNLLS
jgi:hypothetical protein